MKQQSLQKQQQRTPMETTQKHAGKSNFATQRSLFRQTQLRYSRGDDWEELKRRVEDVQHDLKNSPTGGGLSHGEVRRGSDGHANTI